MIFCRLSQALPAFRQADTSSIRLGTLAPARYEQLALKEEGDATYAQLRVSSLPGGAAWICARWRGRVYAEVDLPPLPAMPPRQERLPEGVLIRHLALHKGFSYDLKEAFYPEPVPGVNVPTGGRTNNCCTFVEGLLAPSAQEALAEGFRWGPEQHAQAMVMGADLFGPVSVWVDAGLADLQADTDALPEPWSVMQVWRAMEPTPTGGHTLLILDADPTSGRVLTLESNRAYGLDGPGYRGIGALDRFRDMHPGSNWLDHTGSWDWDRFRKSYPHRQIARLKVGQIQWIEGGPRVEPVAHFGIDPEDDVYVWSSDGGAYHQLECSAGYDIPADKLVMGEAPSDRAAHACNSVVI